MSDYEVVYHIDYTDIRGPQVAWEAGCPLFVEALQASQNVYTGQAYLQSKLLNVSSKRIHSALIEFEVTYRTGSDDHLRRSANNINLSSTQTYGPQPVPLKQGDVLSIEAHVIRADWDTGSWTSSDPAAYALRRRGLSLSEAALSERAKLLKQSGCTQAREVAEYALERRDGWTLCPCGQPSIGLSICPSCHLNFDKFESCYDNEDDLIRLASDRAEADLRRRQRRPIRLKLLISTVVIVAAAFASIRWLYPNVIAPAITYAQASNMMENGDYPEAYNLFKELGDFGDSKTQAEKAKEADGELCASNMADCFNDGLYEEALELYSNYQDSYQTSSDNSDELLTDLYYLASAGVFYTHQDYSEAENYLTETSLSYEEMGVDTEKVMELLVGVVCGRAEEVYESGDVKLAKEYLSLIRSADMSPAAKEISDEIDHFINVHFDWIGEWEFNDTAEYQDGTRYYIGVVNVNGLKLVVRTNLTSYSSLFYLQGYSSDSDDLVISAYDRLYPMTLNDRASMILDKGPEQDIEFTLNDDGSITLIGGGEGSEANTHTLSKVSSELPSMNLHRN